MRSARWLEEFANNHVISAVLGAHIEMTSFPGVDYPDQTLFQPDEPPLSMDVSHIRSLCTLVENATVENPLEWGVLQSNDFIVVPPNAPTKPPHGVRVALLREVFFKQTDGPSQLERLSASLVAAVALGARVVVLPELPMDEWYPRMQSNVIGEVCEKGLDDDRIIAMAESAKRAGVVLVGGALLRAASLPLHLRDGVTDDFDPEELTHIRNVTLVFDKHGKVVATHMKRHLPKEEGFWEGGHFVPAPGVPSVMRGVLPGLVLGVQTCSDIMRPSTHALAAMGAGLIIIPRATETASSAKWQRIVSGIAATAAAYIVSVPRPAPECDLDLGGNAFVISPTGEELISSTEKLSICDIDLHALGEARVSSYPGYLDIRAEEYAAAWKQVSDHRHTFQYTV